jgi:uncharacterized protein (TIGR02271 family)
MTKLGDHPAGTAHGATADSSDLILSREIVDVSTRWIVSGRIRMRRRIVTETATVQVTLRREELEIEYQNIDQRRGVLTGIAKDGPSSEPPQLEAPVVIVLQQELPEVGVRLEPYEMVTISTGLVHQTERVTTDLRHEQIQLSTVGMPDDGLAAGPSGNR